MKKRPALLRGRASNPAGRYFRDIDYRVLFTNKKTTIASPLPHPLPRPHQLPRPHTAEGTVHNISGAHWRTGRAGVGLCPESRGERARGGWKEGKEENKMVNRSSPPPPPSWELHAWSTPSIAEHSEFAMAEHSADMTPSLLVDPDEKKQKMDHGHGHSHDHADGSAPAKIVALGTVTLGGATFMTRPCTLVN